MWNESYSVRDNYRMAAGCNDITVTDITNPKLKVRLLWEFDIPMDVDVLCIIIRRVHVSPALRSEIIRASNKRLEVI